ncbi:hypothetical protein [Bacillus taeanensis]|uniref:hypothetical protein n=1 Tax=Bacillus taeanensis TaxID=273032 RepID=UPI0015F0D09E|nr:hypothetical protein [Bacillus taeanensis]
MFIFIGAAAVLIIISLFMMAKVTKKKIKDSAQRKREVREQRMTTLVSQNRLKSHL